MSRENLITAGEVSFAKPKSGISKTDQERCRERARREKERKVRIQNGWHKPGQRLR